MKKANPKWTVLDMFSGAGGMSYGFKANPDFKIIGAVDAQIGKPSAARGSLQCNQSYEANMGLTPLQLDLSAISPQSLRSTIGIARGELTVLISCAPCTGFSRAQPKNHVIDDHRNSLVTRTALFVEEFKPAVLLMENARELIAGNFSHHYQALSAKLRDCGYFVCGQVHMLDRFGLPQRRERAIIVAARSDLTARTLDDLWRGFKIRPEATHVRRAIGWLPPVQAGQQHPADNLHIAPSFSSPSSVRRLELMPHDGGSWADLVGHPETAHVLTPAMRRYAASGDFGSHPDVYGRLWWDRPAVTIKRECAHVGNGRYAHPEQARLCTVREMAILQGFPRTYQFVASGTANMYRHIGDAVPPLISFQLSKVCAWMLSGVKPSIDSILLPETHLVTDDIQVEFDASYPVEQLALRL